LPPVAQRVLLESAHAAEATHPVLLVSLHAVFAESPHGASLVVQADEQLVCWQQNHFGPVLQPGNPANSSAAVGARAIHRLKASMRNTPLNWSSRHSVQNGHAGAIRAKTGD
jgi:hypothetical protein